MPSKHGTLVNRSQRVVVLPDTAPDEDFVSRVYKHYQSYVHLIRSSKAPNSIASRAARAVGRGGLLPQVQGARFFQPPRRQAAREDEVRPDGRLMSIAPRCLENELPNRDSHLHQK